MTITTVWSDLRGEEVRHTRRIDSHVTLCGLGTEHTRNFVRGSQRADVRCNECAVAVARINAEAAWTWPAGVGAGPRIDSANFPSNKEGL